MGETSHSVPLCVPSRRHREQDSPARAALGTTADEIDVLLTTEGTYPYVTGGVSTWAHQLVTGLSEKRFVVYSVVANPNASLHYEPPPNVAHLVPVPLWGTEDAAEFNPRPGWVSRGLRRPGKRFEAEFLPAYESLVVSVALGQGGPTAWSDHCAPCPHMPSGTASSWLCAIVGPGNSSGTLSGRIRSTAS